MGFFARVDIACIFFVVFLIHLDSSRYLLYPIVTVTHILYARAVTDLRSINCTLNKTIERYIVIQTITEGNLPLFGFIMAKESISMNKDNIKHSLMNQHILCLVLIPLLYVAGFFISILRLFADKGTSNKRFCLWL